MSKPLYAVRNGDNVLGMLWETNSGKEIFVTLTNEIDINFDLEVLSLPYGDATLANVDLRDLLMDALPHSQKNEE